MKKKIISLLLILLVLITIVGCGKKDKKEVKEKGEKKVASWEIDTTAETLNIPKDARNAFTKAVENYDGVELKPIALLGTQVVSGTNYMYLCKSTTVTEKPETSYVIVIVYKDLNGNSKITFVKDFDYTEYVNKDIDIDTKEVSGGWIVYDKTSSQELNDVVQKIYDNSLKELTGFTYKPIALLGTQLVSGTNYAVLALGTTTTKNPKNYITVLTIYNDLNNEATVKYIAMVDLADFNK